MNRAVAQMAGYENVQELMTQTASCLYANSADREHMTALLAQHGECRGLELESVRKDGTKYWISLSAVLQRDKAGVPEKILGIVQDITERKRLAMELERREASFRAIFDHAPVGISFTTDSGIILVNAEHARITGVPVADSKAPGVFGRASHPEDYARQKDAAKKFHSGAVGHYTVEKRYLHPDGRVQWAELTSRFYTDPATGERTIVTIIADIAEHKVAAEVRHASEEQHRAILQTAMDGFWRVDLQGRLLEVNAAYCRMSGYTEAELLTMSISDLEATEAPADTAARMQRILAQRENRFESRHRRKGGSIFEVEVSAQYKPTEGGSIVAFLRDITGHKQAVGGQNSV